MNKICYRPHRGTLAEAMSEQVEFDNMEDLLDFIVREYGKQFSKEDVYFAYYCYDKRVDWETYTVSVARYGNENYMEKYHCPQAIGFMTFK